MSIEHRFDIGLVAEQALKEKQIQQNYRPIIAVHKWFARRPGSLFRGLVLAEFGDGPLKDTYFQPNQFPGKVVLDPFMGGGTPLLEANRLGCDVLGFDINPMAAWIVREEIEHLEMAAYRVAAKRLMEALESDVGDVYRTDCPRYGDLDVPVKYFLWVKVVACLGCGRDVDLFPGYLVATDSRHPRHVLVCPDCGDLNEPQDIEKPGECETCASTLRVVGPAKKGKCPCPNCGVINSYPQPKSGSPRHRLFAIEYFNPHQSQHPGRFFKKPDQADLDRAARAGERWVSHKSRFVPTTAIQPGDESSRLHRWGYARYCDLFNSRQLLGLDKSCALVAGIPDRRVRAALATNLSDLLRYQNLLCRYDTTALKSLDIFSVHGFPVGLVQCESNLLGIANRRGVVVGSGGWLNVVEKYAKAKSYCDAPFEIQHRHNRKVVVPIKGEWIGENRPGARSRSVSIRCASSTDATVEAASVDAIFTDPPYFGNVQYGELMEFCYVWLRRLVGPDHEGFERESSRAAQELTGNETESRGLASFAAGLSQVFTGMGRALKDAGPLAFTFHHNDLAAYQAVGVAILNGGFGCTAAIPCPAEMGGSIHIHGTASSIVDTVFVCRKSSVDLAYSAEGDPADLVGRINGELRLLITAGLKPSLGDIRCIVFGHLTRCAVNALRPTWDRGLPIEDQLGYFADRLTEFGTPSNWINPLVESVGTITKGTLRELPLFPQEGIDAVSL